MSAAAPLLAIVGPTGSGKSDVAMELAALRGGEIISCDSVQVYRDFAIGCAKPSAADRARVPHHLIDVVDHSAPFDAQRFRALASDAILDIRRRGRQPILCGGTGLYLRALRYGLVDVPEADPSVRAGLYEQERRVPGSLFARLRVVDPETAARVDPRNLVFVVRALEIHAAAGEPASRVRARHGFAREDVPMRVFVVDWAPELLRRRILVRAEAMVAAGLLAEVAGLLSRGVDPECRPMRSVGYREAVAVVLGRDPEAGLASRIAQSTAAYAKRQRTWFRRERDVSFVTVTSPKSAVVAIVAALNQGPTRAMH